MTARTFTPDEDRIILDGRAAGLSWTAIGPCICKRKTMAEIECLWTSRELAAFMRYSESTITRIVSQNPEKLPPRISVLSRPRWLPETVYQWARQSAPTQARVARRGRPRLITP